MADTSRSNIPLTSDTPTLSTQRENTSRTLQKSFTQELDHKKTILSSNNNRYTLKPQKQKSEN